jgi:signal transduction histidine kinase
MFFGLLFTLSFFGLGVYAVSRDRAFLHYGLFLLGMSGYMVDAFFNIYGNIFPMREHPILVMYLVYFLVTIMNVFHIHFIRAYIKSNINFPRWDRIAYFVIWINVVLGMVAWGVYFFTTDEFLTDKLIIPVIIATYLFIFTIIIPIFWYKKWTKENLLIFVSVFLFIIAILINTVSIFNGTNLKILETQLILSLVILIFSVGSMMGLASRFHQHQIEKQSIQRLKDLNKLKTQFYQNITHEFRTPLTVISGMIHELKENLQPQPNSDTYKMISSIQRNSKSLLGLVNDLLEVAKMNQSSNQLNIQQEDIVDYLRYIVQSMESYAVAKEIRLQFVSEIITLKMGFDEEKLRQVIYNLTSNAIKFSKDGQEVNIFLRKENNENQEGIIINIQDRGMGIAKEEIPFIFDRFYQGKYQGNNNIIGSGIGLSVVKKWVDLMDGKIWVESVVSKGTLIKVFLPIKNELAPVGKNITPLQMH